MANKNRCSNLHYTHLWLSWTVFAIAGMLLMASCSRPAAPVFEKDFALTISTEGQGSVNQRVINEGDFTAGTPKRVELTASPAEGLEFAGWQGDIQGDQNPVVIEVDRNKEIVAMFLGRPSVSTNDISDIESTSAVSGGNVTDDGGATVTNRGVCWSTSQNPTKSNSCTSDGTGTGSYTSSLNNLNPDTRYYVRAYASNSVGTAYGDQREFRTQVQVSLPTVSTSSISSITQTSAVSGGSVTDDGGATVTNRGVCWSTSQNPTKSNSCTTDGSGIGSFSSSLSGLSASRTYFVRAYASNSAGTAYGNQLEFRTLEPNWPRDTQTAVVEVTSATGRIWMDRNLGASRRATSSTDSQAYGDLYQWGRSADGHQKRNSPTTSTLSGTDTPGHGDFILATTFPNDWRDPQNGNLWQGVNGINNPCPVGYRLPTESEWEAERRSWSSSNAAGAFNSPLRLPVAGFRNDFRGVSLFDVGYVGFCWSGTVAGTGSFYLFFDSSFAYMSSLDRAYGYSVRCLKN